jgi:hypothetical protein
MRLIQQILTLLFVLAIASGCHSSPTTSAPSFHRFYGGPDVIFAIDNHGGYSHLGRRISLKADRKCVQTTYTDAIGVDEEVKTGTYAQNANRTRLVLAWVGGQEEVLVRVDFQGLQYWVHEADREVITRPDQEYLRQISLRLERR